MSKHTSLTSEEMLETIERSGYLLESELCRALAAMGYFVEPNQVIEDPVTGKSREIDLTAEYYEYDPEQADERIVAGIKFVFEVKNNSQPLVLLTKEEFSPNIESYTGIKEAITKPEELDNVYYEGLHEWLMENYSDHVYTQYCSFQKKNKNDELMALHPENIHSGLQKITFYCEERLSGWENREFDTYFRHFWYLPVLLISDDLYELTLTKDKPKLSKVESSVLIVNYHYKKEQKLCYVFVVTKKGFIPFITQMRQLEIDLKNKMRSFKAQHQAASK